MSADFSEEFDNIAFTVARFADEMAGSGSYYTTGLYRVGIIDRDQLDGHWSGIQRARWVAEDGIRRMQEEVVDDEGNPWAWQNTEEVARAFLYAAASNRVIGETFCYGTVQEADSLGAGGGAEQPPEQALRRALRFANDAISHGTGAGEDDIVTAAHGIKAQAYVGLDDWSNAVTEAALVPIDFVFDAVYSNNSGREQNVIYEETFERPEISCYDAYCGSFDPPDLRAPYTKCDVPGNNCQGGANGADGLTPHWRQDKLDELGANMPVVKGTEMVLIEAESELRSGRVPEAMVLINDVRAYYGVTPDLTAANEDEAWVHLDRERYLDMWLEGRRMFDMNRWDTPENRNRLPLIRFLYGDEYIVYPMSSTLSKRASCLPIGFDECNANQNLSLGEGACADP
jgi:hypothetical protein